MADRPSSTNALVVLEALFYGIAVQFGGRSFNLGSNSEDEPCITTTILMDDEDDVGRETESECLMEVDLDLGDFLKECVQLGDDYITELALQTALVKVQERINR